MLFSSANYRWLGIGCLLLLIGYTAMRLENEVHGWVSLYFSPIVLLCGYLIVIYAILKPHRDSSDPETAP